MMARRPRPKLVTLTDPAASRVAEIMDEKGAGYLRVGVKNGGCAGMEYLMEYVDAPEAFDEMVEDNGVKIVVDAKAVLFLLGAVVDYEVTPLHEKVRLQESESDRCLRMRRECYDHPRRGLNYTAGQTDLNFRKSSFMAGNVKECLPSLDTLR